MDLLAASIRIATPLLLAALGGLLSERAGVFAVGLEGMMLSGAFAAVVGAASGSEALGIAAAAVAGAVAGLLVAIVAVRFRADNMVTGLSINIAAVGATSTLLRITSGAGRIHLPTMPPFLSQPPLTWLALASCLATAWFLRNTQAGLTLTATGENPDAVFAAGTDPRAVRMRAVVACGALAGLGGAVLPLQQVGGFTDNMTGGRGYLALAALIVGRWSPFGTALACLAFGAAEALELQLEAGGIAANPYLLQMTPYVLALAVLAVLGRSARLPAAIGRPLESNQP